MLPPPFWRHSEGGVSIPERRVRTDHPGGPSNLVQHDDNKAAFDRSPGWAHDEFATSECYKHVNKHGADGVISLGKSPQDFVPHCGVGHPRGSLLVSLTIRQQTELSTLI